MPSPQESITSKAQTHNHSTHGSPADPTKFADSNASNVSRLSSASSSPSGPDNPLDIESWGVNSAGIKAKCYDCPDNDCSNCPHPDNDGKVDDAGESVGRARKGDAKVRVDLDDNDEGAKKERKERCEEIQD